MAQDITIAGATFNSVPSIVVPTANNGSAIFVDPSPTTAAAADVASGKYFFDALGALTQGTASGGGGGGIGTLLLTESLGLVNIGESTTETDLNKSIVINNVANYDLLFVVTSVDSIPNLNRHVATGQFWLLLSDDADVINNKKSRTVLSSNWQCFAVFTGANYYLVSKSSGTAVGVYGKGAAINNNNFSFNLYAKYNSTITKTINGNYTTRIYGINLVDLIGGRM